MGLLEFVLSVYGISEGYLFSSLMKHIIALCSKKKCVDPYVGIKLERLEPPELEEKRDENRVGVWEIHTGRGYLRVDLRVQRDLFRDMLEFCACSRWKRNAPSSQINMSTGPKMPPVTKKSIIFVLKLQSVLICFQESIDLTFGCMDGKQKRCFCWVLCGILFIFLHCFALLYIMQCKDSFSEDKQQMSIDGYAAAAQTQVHPVSAHLLPLGNKFLPKVGESALYFCFFIYFFFVHTVFLQFLT